MKIKLRNIILAGAGALALVLGGSSVAVAGGHGKDPVNVHPTYHGDCTGFTVTATVDTNIQWAYHDDPIADEVTQFGSDVLKAGEQRFYATPETAGEVNLWSASFDMPGTGKGYVVNAYPVLCPLPETRWVETDSNLDCEAGTVTITETLEAAEWSWIGDDWVLGEYVSTGETREHVIEATEEECPLDEVEEPGDEEPGEENPDTETPPVDDIENGDLTPPNTGGDSNTQEDVKNAPTATTAPVVPEYIETAAPAALANTGSSAALPITVGGVTLLLGAALLAFTYRRRAMIKE